MFTIKEFYSTLFVVVICSLMSGCLQLSDKLTVTSYSIRRALDGKSWFPQNPTTFVLDIEKQTAISNTINLYKFEKCKILNVDNWECEYNDKSANIGYRAGEYFSDDSEYLEMVAAGKVKEVSWFVWWLYHLGIK